MLRRIIAMSSNTESKVMDCFCGGGGFLQEALKLGRKFIGIDESVESIKLNQQWIKKSENHLFSRNIALIKKLASNRIINEVKGINRVVRQALQNPRERLSGSRVYILLICGNEYMLKGSHRIAVIWCLIKKNLVAK
ncbi:hypothetical protein T36_0886 [Helicobacter cinaedi]|nr:hypothetical protein T36_0886 [Helicobacter cinaedi]